MKFRVFSTKHNLYTNSAFWPSNQRTTSDFAISPSGEILEIIEGENIGPFIIKHSPKDFIVEPWTGYFDSAGKKIYRGDLLEMRSMYDFLSEVGWQNGAFWLIPKDNEGLKTPFTSAQNWTIVGNIHCVEYSD